MFHYIWDAIQPLCHVFQCQSFHFYEDENSMPLTWLAYVSCLVADQ